MGQRSGGRVSTRGDFAPEGTFGNVCRHFWLSQGVVGGAIRATDRHTSVRRKPPRTKNDLVPMSVVLHLRNPTALRSHWQSIFKLI